jgi:CheY-like chemotaxis protein
MQKVLVVDDSLSVRKVVEKALEGRGLQVLAAASGAEAIQMIDRDRPDVVICDVILPDKDGYQVCQYVRTHPLIGATPVLLISGIDNGTVQARAAEVRSNEVMFKPFGIDDLVRKIDNLLARSSNGTKKEAATVAPRARVSAPASTTPVPASNGLSSASTTPAVSNQGLKQRLQALAGTPGIRFVVLTDREGFLIETAGELSPDADEVAGALASCLAEASDGIGRELGQGRLVSTILEYESGTLLLHGVGPSALLAVLVGDPGALGKVRYYVRKEVPELVRAL